MLRLHPRKNDSENFRVPEFARIWKILTVASELNMDLIVLASQGRIGLGSALLGCAAARVVRHASCPVLTEKVVRHARCPVLTFNRYSTARRMRGSRSLKPN
jgi:nucleotide-binding universal stress UspA family protein